MFFSIQVNAQVADTTFHHYSIKKDINVNRINFAEEKFGFVISSDLNSTEDILNRFGVSFIRRGNYAPEPVLRGLNTNQIDVTVNGMKIMPACTDKMDPVTSYVETENLGEVEIESGNGNSSFLSKSGGRIDLGLYKPVFSKSLKYYGNFKTGYQFAADNYKGSLSLNISDNFFTFNVNSTYNASGDYNTGGGNEVWNSGYEKYNVSLNGSFKINESDYLNINGIIDDAYDVGYPALLMDVGSAKARIAGLDYQAGNLFKIFYNSDFKIYYNRIDHVMDDSKRNNGFRMDMPGSTETFGSTFNGLVSIDKNTNFTTGLEYTNSLISADMTMYFSNNIPMYMVTWPDVKRNLYSLKFSLNRSVTQDFMISPFIGYGYQNSKIENLTGFNSLQIFYPDIMESSARDLFNAGIKFSRKISNSVLTEITASYSERFPTVSEEYGFFLYNKIDNYDYIGNPYLKNEGSFQLNLGINFTKESFSLRTNLFGYYFQNYILGEFDPLISAMTPGSFGAKIYNNIGEAFLSGFELNLMMNVSRNISLSGVFNYAYGNEKSGDPLPLIPPFNSTFSIRYSGKDYYLQFEELINAPQINVSQRNLESTSVGYFISNIRAFYFINKWISVNGGIENILDKEYYNHLDWLKIPQEGRNFYCDVRINF